MLDGRALIAHTHIQWFSHTFAIRTSVWNGIMCKKTNGEMNLITNSLQYIQWDFNRPTTFASRIHSSVIIPAKSKTLCAPNTCNTNKPHTFTKHPLAHIRAPVRWIFAPLIQLPFRLRFNQNAAIFSLRCHYDSKFIKCWITVRWINRHYKIYRLRFAAKWSGSIFAVEIKSK